MFMGRLCKSKGKELQQFKVDAVFKIFATFHNSLDSCTIYLSALNSLSLSQSNSKSFSSYF